MEPGADPVRRLSSGRVTKRACVDCHARKVRCDVATRGIPCSNCVGANVDCRVAERKKRRRPATPGRGSEGRRHQGVPAQVDLPAPDLRHLNLTPSRPPFGDNTPEAEVQSSIIAAPENQSWPDKADHNRNEDRNQHVPTRIEPSNDPNLESAPPHHDGEHVEEEDSSHSPAAAAEYAGEFELAKQHLVNFFSQNLQDNPIRMRVSYVGTELSNLHHLTREQASDHHVFHYPTANTYIPRVVRNSQQTLVAPSLIPQDAFVMPPPHIADVLVTDYFALIHPAFPIVKRDVFLRQFRAWAAGSGLAATASENVPSTSATTGARARAATPQPPTPPDAPTFSILLLQAICLAGSHVNRTFKHNKQELKASFFRRAKALLEGRYEEDRVEMVQAALLLSWFSDGGDDVCANSWWWVGVAARTALGLGMHREVGPSKMCAADKRLWRRIWWCLVQFDCLVAMSYGRPMNINLDDCDVLPLRVDEFDDDHAAPGGAADFVMRHAELCAIISELSRTHFSVKEIKAMKMEAAGCGGHSDKRRTALETVDARLAEWLVGLPRHLRHWQGNHSSSSRINREQLNETQPWSMLLHLTYSTALAQFHRTAVIDKSSTSNTSSYDTTSDEEICAESAANVISIFEQLSRETHVHLCFVWGPSSLFTAMLHVRSQLTSSRNAILALRAREKYESGLQSLRRLGPYWLFSTSVWRLFESSSIQTPNSSKNTPGVARNTAGGGFPPTSSNSTTERARQNGDARQQGSGVSPQMMISPEMLISSPHSADTAVAQMGQLGGGAGSGAPLTHPQGSPQEMAWVQFLTNANLMASNNGSMMHMERNRWNDSLDAWQSMYWSDPLAHIDLNYHDHPGHFHQEWQP